MPKGSKGIPALELVTLNKLITKFDRAPNMFFTNMIPETNYESDTIKWEIEYGSAGMTPFVAPGAVAPATGMDGVSEASAKAAFMKEKMYFDEEFLNNLRKPGTDATYHTAERKLSRGSQKLRRRIDRRREWMIAKMLVDGTLTYNSTGGLQFTVNYGVPDAHKVTLATNDKWAAGSTRNPMSDFFDGNQVLIDDVGKKADITIMNSNTLQVLLQDNGVGATGWDGIQGLLKKSAFGSGDLFSNPSSVIGNLLGIGDISVYDEHYETTGWITAAFAADATTVYLDDATDFEAGTVRFFNMLTNTYVDVTCSAVDKAANTLTVGVTGAVFVAGRDKVIMRKKFIADNKVLMIAKDVDGAAIGEWMAAPYGVDRRWGVHADTKDEWDPEGIWLRVQDKGLPVLYHNDATYTLTVG